MNFYFIFNSVHNVSFMLVRALKQHKKISAGVCSLVEPELKIQIWSVTWALLLIVNVLLNQLWRIWSLFIQLDNIFACFPYIFLLIISTYGLWSDCIAASICKSLRFLFFAFFSSIFETHLSHWNHILWCSINGNL